MSDKPHNIFDTNKARDKVPVTIEKDGKRIQVGEATITDSGEFLHVEMDVKSDDPNDVVSLLNGGMHNYSIEEPNGRTNHLSDHRHHPVQHRDNREPWCDICKLTENFGHPKKAMWR